MTNKVPRARVRWPKAYRVINSRYPPIDVFERIADPADWDALLAIEALTNPRIRDELGDLQLVPAEERVSGAGSTPVMAAFTHLNPEGSRFSDGSYGVYYAAQALETAIAEVGHHRAVFLARTAEPSMEIDLRLISANVDAELHDLRGLGEAGAKIFHPDHYASSQALGRRLRAAGSWGVLFPSVRHPGGFCIGAFRPRALGRARVSGHYTLHWDGERITHWYEKRGLRTLAS